MELVGTQGVAAMTMRAVCREAGLSQKFFYESFTDTDQLLHAVYRAALDVARHAVDESDSPATDLPSQMRQRVDAAARLVREDPRICRILLIEPVADLRLRRYVRETLAATFRGGADDNPRIKMHYATTFGAIISLFVEWTEGNLGEDRAAFVDHVTDLLSSSPLAERVAAAPLQGVPH